MIITIDGPSASGKTTIARMLAEKLGYYYLSSGLLFRGLAYALIQDYHYTNDMLANPQDRDIDAIVGSGHFIYKYDPQLKEQLWYKGENITKYLRDSRISTGSSLLGLNKAVRAQLAGMQHAMATEHNLIAEGRDMGSAIFPDASIKFFLTASIEARASRWAADQKVKGRLLGHKEAIAEVSERDNRDAQRAIGPLVISAGAIIIDDTHIDQDAVVKKMLEIIKEYAAR